jgi:hypothetical protein
MPKTMAVTTAARHRTAADQRLVQRLRSICLALPEAREKTSHGEPTWFAGPGKVFAMVDEHHHHAPHLSAWLPLPFGAQETLMTGDPARFFRPPYVGGRGWVGLVLDTRPDWDQVARLVREAYLHVATKKLAARLVGPATRPKGSPSTASPAGTLRRGRKP